MANEDLKQEIKKSGVRFWQIADELGCVDATFSRKLRYELPEAEKTKILEIVAKLAGKGYVHGYAANH